MDTLSDVEEEENKSVKDLKPDTNIEESEVYEVSLTINDSEENLLAVNKVDETAEHNFNEINFKVKNLFQQEFNNQVLLQQNIISPQIITKLVQKVFKAQADYDSSIMKNQKQAFLRKLRSSKTQQETFDYQLDIDAAKYLSQAFQEYCQTIASNVTTKGSIVPRENLAEILQEFNILNFDIETLVFPENFIRND